jgi:serine carboxypeptidase-like clade 1
MNLKGYLVGNGATNWDFDVSPSFPHTLYGFNMVPKKVMDAFDANNCTYYFNDFKKHDGPEACDDLWNQIQSYSENLNWYDLYLAADGPPPKNTHGVSIVGGEEKIYKRGFTAAEYTPWLKKYFREDHPFHYRIIDGSDPLADYLNNATVREVLHVPETVQAWGACNGFINENWEIGVNGSYWIYPIMKEAGIRMRFYSGDTDGAVPTYGTKRWINQLNWTVTEEWGPWKGPDGQVAGYKI